MNFRHIFFTTYYLYNYTNLDSDITSVIPSLVFAIMSPSYRINAEKIENVVLNSEQEFFQHFLHKLKI